MVTGHGVAADLITRTRQRAIDFFRPAVEEKNERWQRPPATDKPRLHWLGERSIAYSMDQAAPPDIYRRRSVRP